MPDLYNIYFLLFEETLKIIISPIFWAVILLVGYLYRKDDLAKEKLYGIREKTYIKYTFLATLYGILGGVIGSFLIFLFGISLNEIGIGYIWIVALILLLINPRFLCFSYGGSILSLSSIFFGWPSIKVPHLMGLVAILHIIESVLIFLTRNIGQVPVYIKHSTGRTVGAFSMRKFWPIPFVVLITFESFFSTTISILNMPDWWPILKLDSFSTGNIYNIIPVIAALGYADIAITTEPKKRSTISSLTLLLYSLTLLLLCIVADKMPFLNILPAIFGALGHELTIWYGRKKETKIGGSPPIYKASEIGVKILYVFKKTPAGKIGLKSGDIILSINRERINTTSEFRKNLEQIANYLEIEYIRGEDNKLFRKGVFLKNNKNLGIVPVPEYFDKAHVEITSQGILLRFLKRFFR